MRIIPAGYTRHSGCYTLSEETPYLTTKHEFRAPPNPKSNNLITVQVDGPSNDLKPNSHSGSIHNSCSSRNSMAQNPPSHSFSEEVVPVPAFSSDASEAASRIKIASEELLPSSPIGQTAAVNYSPKVVTDLVKFGATVNSISVVTGTDNSEGKVTSENGKDDDYFCEDVEQGTWELVKYTSDSIKKHHDDIDDGWEVL